MNPERFACHSLDQEEWGKTVKSVLAAALSAVDPAAAVARYMTRDGSILEVAGTRYDLNSFRRVYLVGMGKAGAPMAASTADILGENLHAGLVIVKEGYTGENPLPFLREAGHPVPDRRGVAATQELLTLLDEAGEDDLVVCLVSGGGSALLVDPAPGISLSDLQELTSLLLASGASIAEINTIRKHLDQVKGGGLARRAAPAAVLSLVLSDVIGNHLDAIASGPLSPDPTTYAQALAILERYGLLSNTPAPVIDHLNRGLLGKVAETPKPGDSAFARVQQVIIGSNRQAMDAAAQAARQAGMYTEVFATPLLGEAQEAGASLAAVLRQAAGGDSALRRPFCLVAGGETTVTVRGSGLGGRNQELALGAVNALSGLLRVALVSFATDGGDGPTDAAGAVVTGETLRRARQLGLDPATFLAKNDAYHFFDPLGDLIMTGPTMTNVNDLVLLCAM